MIGMAQEETFRILSIDLNGNTVSVKNANTTFSVATAGNNLTPQELTFTCNGTEVTPQIDADGMTCSFAEPEFMEQYLNITPGSVSVLGLMNDPENKVRLLIDKDILENHPYFGCHPCINTSSLKFRTEDLLNKILPAIHHNYTIVDLPYAE